MEKGHDSLGTDDCEECFYFLPLNIVRKLTREKKEDFIILVLKRGKQKQTGSVANGIIDSSLYFQHLNKEAEGDKKKPQRGFALDVRCSRRRGQAAEGARHDGPAFKVVRRSHVGALPQSKQARTPYHSLLCTHTTRSPVLNIYSVRFWRFLATSYALRYIGVTVQRRRDGFCTGHDCYAPP